MPSRKSIFKQTINEFKKGFIRTVSDRGDDEGFFRTVSFLRGPYKITHKATMTRRKSLDSGDMFDIEEGQIVDVRDVRLVKTRIRGHVTYEGEKGWISIKSLNEWGWVWAMPLEQTITKNDVALQLHDSQKYDATFENIETWNILHLNKNNATSPLESNWHTAHGVDSPAISPEGSDLEAERIDSFDEAHQNPQKIRRGTFVHFLYLPEHTAVPVRIKAIVWEMLEDFEAKVVILDSHTAMTLDMIGKSMIIKIKELNTVVDFSDVDMNASLNILKDKRDSLRV